jgi:hypothetical protein
MSTLSEQEWQELFEAEKRHKRRINLLTPLFAIPFLGLPFALFGMLPGTC